jgi:glutathione S-transferase
MLGMGEEKNQMSRFKLTYFDFNGGRGEPIRIAFHAAGIDFEDHRISFDEFRKNRRDMRFNCVPELDIDGVTVTQSNSMLRYVGKMAGLYPGDDLQALYCDETMDAVEDLLHQMVQTFGLEGDQLEAARKKLVDGWLSVFIKGLAEILERGGGKYFAGNSLTVADLKVFVQIRSLRAGTLDHVPSDLVDKLAPGLVQHVERVAKEPIVTAYYAARA